MRSVTCGLKIGWKRAQKSTQWTRSLVPFHEGTKPPRRTRSALVQDYSSWSSWFFVPSW